MILTFFKGLLREFWLLVKDPRGIFMFLVAPLLMNIVVCGAFQNGIVNHSPLAAVEMSSSAKTRELIRAFDESDRFDVPLVLQDLDEAKRKMEEGEVYAIETFASTGMGLVMENGEASHFAVIPEHFASLRMQNARKL